MSGNKDRAMRLASLIRLSDWLAQGIGSVIDDDAAEIYEAKKALACQRIRELGFVGFNIDGTNIYEGVPSIASVTELIVAQSSDFDRAEATR